MSEEPKAAGRQPRVQVSLKDREKAALWSWLQGMRERIERERIPPVALVPLAADALSLPQLNRGHVRHALSVLDIPVFRSPGTAGARARNRLGAVVADLSVRVGQLEARCAAQAADLQALQRLVEETADRLTQKWQMRDGRAVPVNPHAR